MKNLSSNLRCNGFIKCIRFQRMLFFYFLLANLGESVIFAMNSKQPNKMSIIANHNAIVIMRSNGVIGNFIGGNKDFKQESEEILTQEEVELFEAYKKSRKKSKQKESKEEEEEEKEEKPKRKYKMNKSKVRKKALAFGYLKDSEKFLGFYSISFPLGSSDEICRKALNVWLTNLRQKYKLTNYMWVAERQKNGTLHFHLLTNNRMPIKEVNLEMAEILQNYEKKKLLSFGNSALDKYNGVDLSYAGKRRKNDKKNNNQKIQTQENRRRFITRYITKYIIKQNQEWDFLPNHWSRSISALNHGVKLTLEEERIATEYILSEKFKGKVFTNDYCLMYFPDEELPNILIKRLLEENERVYKLACERLNT